MPATYNGVGTHYYGKRNLVSRKAVCKQCEISATLSSYETRLFVVALFIPVIPLGKKRIIDDCSNCRRHYVMPLQKWEEMQQLGISSAKAEYEKEPTLEKAISYHQTLVTFNEHAQAVAFQKEITEKYGNQALLHAYLGASLHELGLYDESQAAYEQSHRLKSELPQARVGLAMAKMRAGELDEARNLLSFLEHPGAEQLHSLEPLEILANQFQDKRRHEEALDLYEKLLLALPSIAQHSGFRKRVAKSEKALGRKATSLPSQSFSLSRLWNGPQRKLVVWAGLTVAGLIVAGIHNEVTRQRAVLYLVNGHDKPADFVIDGEKRLKVGAKSHTEVMVSEGTHEVAISGAVTDHASVELRQGYFERWFGDVAWIVNAGGDTVLAAETAHYSQSNIPSTFEFYAGKVIRIPSVSHPFTKLPETVSMKQSERERILVGLEVIPQSVIQVANFLLEKREYVKVMNLLEPAMQARPENELWFGVYQAAARLSGNHDRALSYLKSGLDVLPVNIALHRAYQDEIRVQNVESRNAELVAEYDARLAKFPENGALLYLRGRVTSDKVQENEFFERAVKKDPSLAWPHFALAYQHISAGNWAAARPLLEKAITLAPNHYYFTDEWINCRFALGEYEDIIKELRENWPAPDAPLSLAYLLAEVYVKDKNDPDLYNLQSQVKGRLRHSTLATEEQKAFDSFVFYLENEMEKMLNATTGEKELVKFRCQALVELGRLEEAEKLIPKASGNDLLFPLSMSLAWKQKGDEVHAKAWLDQAIKITKKNHGENSDLAIYLSNLATANLDGLAEFPLDSQGRAVVAALIAKYDPAHRDKAAEYVKRMNFRLTYPHYLVEKAMSQL